MASVATMAAREIRLPEQTAGVNSTTALERSPARPKATMGRIEEHPEWLLLARIPMRLSAEVSLPGFRVRDLLALRVGQMLLSQWSSAEDIPLKIGSVQLSWSEFEVVEQRLAVRITRLA